MLHREPLHLQEQLIKKTHMLQHALDSLGYAEDFLLEAGPVSNPLLADALAAVSKAKDNIESAMTARGVPSQKFAY